MTRALIKAEASLVMHLPYDLSDGTCMAVFADLFGPKSMDRLTNVLYAACNRLGASGPALLELEYQTFSFRSL